MSEALAQLKGKIKTAMAAKDTGLPASMNSGGDRIRVKARCSLRGHFGKSKFSHLIVFSR